MKHNIQAAESAATTYSSVVSCGMFDGNCVRPSPLQRISVPRQVQPFGQTLGGWQVFTTLVSSEQQVGMVCRQPVAISLNGKNDGAYRISQKFKEQFENVLCDHQRYSNFDFKLMHQ